MQVHTTVIREPERGLRRRLSEPGPGPDRPHPVFVDVRAVDTAERLFSALAAAVPLPDYFGHNWDALGEVLADYVDLSGGGLGSAWGGTGGIAARAVSLALTGSEGLLRRGEDLVRALLDTVEHVRAVNADGPAADLDLTFHLDPDAPDTALTTLRRLTGSAPPRATNGTFAAS